MSEQRRPRHGAVEDDLRSRLACIAETTSWDRPYDTRMDAIRGLCDLTTNGMEPAPAPAAIDATHLAHQREWSRETFGPGPRLGGVLDHIRRELKEVEARPFDVTEWADVLILAFDGAWRCGHEPQDVIDAIKTKQAVNEARTWPDWRDYSEDEAIEHIEPTHDVAACQMSDVRCLAVTPHPSHDWSSLRHRWCCPGVPEPTTT